MVLAVAGTLGTMAMGGIAMSTAPRHDVVDDDTTTVTPATALQDGAKRYLPGEIRDTAAFFNEAKARERKDFAAKINVLTRTYGDSVVLRWAADDYVSWRYLNRVGVNIVRMDKETYKTDTVVLGLKPATLDEFRSRYADHYRTALDLMHREGYGIVQEMQRLYNSGLVAPVDKWKHLIHYLDGCASGPALYRPYSQAWTPLHLSGLSRRHRHAEQCHYPCRCGRLGAEQPLQARAVRCEADRLCQLS